MAKRSSSKSTKPADKIGFVGAPATGSNPHSAVDKFSKEHPRVVRLSQDTPAKRQTKTGE